MNEQEFLLKLQRRAKEQEHVMKAMPFSSTFTNISVWLGYHPWRILIPIAFLLTLAFHFSLGKSYDNVILRVFGGLGIIKIL
jgi:hypothetical protein